MDAFQEYFEELTMQQEEIDARVLFPPESDFSKVCSCNECCEQIKYLKEFEADLRSRAALAKARVDEVDPNVNLIMSLVSAFDGTVKLWGFLFTNLQRLDKTVGILEINRMKSADDMKKIYFEILQKLVGVNFIGDDDVQDLENSLTDCAAKYAVYADILSLKHEIEVACYHYGDTKFKDLLHILKEFEGIEENHEEDKRLAEEEERPLDVSISESHIVNQIKCLQKLPVDEICQEIEKAMPIIDPKYVNLICKEYNDIVETCTKMIVIRRQFWKQYERNVSLTGNMDPEKHSWSGLKKTLHSLRQQADCFNELLKTSEQDVTPC
ncbi:unnamed protein product [Cuscuta epithymum]|uniref:Uncharacterized protein n=1 Tax=Cuscuta epithymum TaxID=186058 RepID=A0AAV0DC33_9ASTE|nr:unnamed protein product [Cuscuta epithymum]